MSEVVLQPGEYVIRAADLEPDRSERIAALAAQVLARLHAEQQTRACEILTRTI